MFNFQKIFESELDPSLSTVNNWSKLFILRSGRLLIWSKKICCERVLHNFSPNFISKFSANKFSFLKLTSSCYCFIPSYWSCYSLFGCCCCCFYCFLPITEITVFDIKLFPSKSSIESSFRQVVKITLTVLKNNGKNNKQSNRKLEQKFKKQVENQRHNGCDDLTANDLYLFFR